MRSLGWVLLLIMTVFMRGGNLDTPIEIPEICKYKPLEHREEAANKGKRTQKKIQTS